MTKKRAQQTWDHFNRNMLIGPPDRLETARKIMEPTTEQRLKWSEAQTRQKTHCEMSCDQINLHCMKLRYLLYAAIVELQYTERLKQEAEQVRHRRIEWETSAMRKDYLDYTKRHADVYLEMLSALECAETVLILLKKEATVLGCHGKDVLPKVQQAIVHARQL